jgi:hypothetical protein
VRASAVALKGRHRVTGTPPRWRFRATDLLRAAGIAAHTRVRVHQREIRRAIWLRAVLARRFGSAATAPNASSPSSAKPSTGPTARIPSIGRCFPSRLQRSRRSFRGTTLSTRRRSLLWEPAGAASITTTRKPRRLAPTGERASGSRRTIELRFESLATSCSSIAV